MTQDTLSLDISLPRLAFRLGLDPARLARARERVRDYLWLHCDDERMVDEVVLCVEEACTNAIRHSGAQDAMEVTLAFSGDDLLVTARDSGQGFDLTSFDRNAMPDPQASGGRGLFLMAHLMDKLELHFDSGLEVRMLKRSVSCNPSSTPLDPALGNAADTRQRARTRSFLEEIGEAFFAFDWEYRYLHANRLGLRLTGKSLEQLCGHTPWELFPGLEGSPLQAAYREAMEVGRPAVLEHRSLVTDDWLEVRIYPTGVGVSAYYREINERIAREEELRRYHLLAEQARDIMLFVRYADGRILEANVAAEKAYGRSRKELLALSISELRAPQTSPSVRDQMAAASERGVLFETLHRRADGSVFPVEVSSQGTTDVNGERVLLSIVRDISERRGVEAEVRESEQRYRSLFENMLDGYAYCRMIYEDGTPTDFVYLAVNSAFVKLTGLADVVGHKVTEVIPGVRKDNPELFEIYGRVAQSGQPESFETYLEALGIWFSVSVYSPQAQHFVAIFENITERKRIALERQRLLEAETLVAARASEQAEFSRVLLDAADTLSSSLSLSDVLDRLLDVVLSLSGRPRAFVNALDDDRRELTALAGRGPDLAPVGTVVSYDLLSPLVRQTIAERHTQVLDFDMATTPDPTRDLYRSHLVLYVPLFVGGRMIGHLGVDTPGERQPFEVREVKLVEGIASQAAAAIEKSRLYEAQRHIAQTLQENFIHPLPQVAGLELGVVSMPACEPELVGGDFSDVFMVDDRQIVLLIGDVAGKGVRAAGLTETVRSTVRALAAIDSAPDFILGKANELLLRFDPDESHVTAFLAVLDPKTGHLSYASAGHPAPVHLRAFTCGTLDVTFGLPLGTFERTYENAHAVLTPDDYLVLYTDGVTEARRDGELLGERRLLEILEGLRGRSAQEVAEGVRDAAADFAEDRLHDDLQVVVLRLA